MGEVGARVDHCLALKVVHQKTSVFQFQSQVMRLTRPSLGLGSKVPGEEDLIPGKEERDVNTAARLPGLMPGQLLVLPQSFGGQEQT